MTYEVVPNTEEAPWRTIVSVRARFDTEDGPEYKTGSGVVTGRNDVLTASHLVYDSRHGDGVADHVEVVPGRMLDSQPFGTYAAIGWSHEIVDADGNFELEIAEVARDYAVLSFDTALGDRVGWMALDAGFTAGAASLTGYPGLQSGRMVTETASAGPAEIAGVLSLTGFDVDNGHSGGPVWTDGAAGPAVVGLVSTTGWGFQIGGAQYDRILSLMAGNEHLIAADGPIDVTGGALADGISGGDHADRIDGAAGDDTLAGGKGADTLTGGEGGDVLRGGEDNDTVEGTAGNNSLYGGLGDDSMLGGTGNDTINANEGNDTLTAGSAVSAELRGGKGNDSIVGGTGSDTLYSGMGSDTLTGGAGDDIFSFKGGDQAATITDFGTGNDKIEIAGYSFDQLTIFSNGAGNAVISLPDGTSIELQGVDAATLTADFFLFS